ncbi:MAG: alpha-glucuronidase family glycosyl hydrolase [Armatimonadota bacterium]
MISILRFLIPAAIISSILTISAVSFSAGITTDASIIIGANAPAKEQYAAKELQRYIYQLSGVQLPIKDDSAPVNGQAFIVGTPGTNQLIKSAVGSGMISVTPTDPGPEGYVLKRTKIQNADVLFIAGSDDVGTLYGVYGLLDDYYGVGFYPGGDTLPGKRQLFYMPKVDERKSPRQKIRGVLPWTNFPQSATVYSYSDYKFIIDQMAKMRMNFLHIHNYNGQSGHNEMFHNFTYDGITSKVWMGTAKKGHAWAGPGWDINKYIFGAADLFDDYDFGSDGALHNKSLTNEDLFKKGSTLFQQVIAYAHSRGVKVGLGIELDLIMPVYKTVPNNPEVVKARMDQIINDYPDLDYLLCFRSEIIAIEGQNVWQDVFDMVYKRIKTDAPNIRLAISGWGLAADHVKHLPADVIAAPIAPYSAGFENGDIYPGREYWGCPWLERDFNSSVHYYPYNMHLSDTIKGYANRAANMTGFTCLTWRLTDAVDAKMSYIAKAPWDLQDKLDTSRTVYYDYAIKNYGRDAAPEITDIINENEPYACNSSECEYTPEFKGEDRSKDIKQAEDQLALIDKWVGRADDGGEKSRLRLLRNRISSVKSYCELDQGFNKSTWDDLPGSFPAWARTFRDRVTDISSLGNVVSTQNRLVQLRYVAKEDQLRKEQKVKSPSYVEARGTGAGAVITWKNNEPDAKGFNVYRDSVKLTKTPIVTKDYTYCDKTNGFHQYSVSAVSESGIESPQSVPTTCAAGSADRDMPDIVVVSPPTSHASGQPFSVTARVLDNRAYGSLSAALYFRKPGENAWQKLPMQRRVRGVFIGSVPAAKITDEGLEYYIAASDGTNTGFYPDTAPVVNASVVCYKIADKTAPGSPANLKADAGSMKWSASSGDVFWYRIYRSNKTGFTPNHASLVTYVPNTVLQFADMEPGFDGRPLIGKYYYRVTAVDRFGNESKPSNEVAMTHQPQSSGPILEAENAELKNAVVYTDSGASGSQAVGFFGEQIGDSILFPKVSAAKGLKITFSNGTQTDNKCSLYINGKDVATLTFPVTVGWYIYETLSVDIPVKGSVELRVDADDLAVNKGFCANIDCIETW